MTIPAGRDECPELDELDPLADFGKEFDLPPGIIYLDGNSLGAMPRAASARVRKMVEDEWAWVSSVVGTRPGGSISPEHWATG
jgi:kynureninase